MSRREGRYLHPSFAPPKRRPRINTLCSSAVVVAIDPGGTTGWAVWQVHPEALSDPEVKILENVQFWEHGQLDCGATRGNAGTSAARSATEILREEAGQLLGGGNLGVDEEGSFAISGADPLGVSTKGESAGASEILSLIDNWPGAAIVIEDFILRRFDQGRDLLSPVRITEKVDFGLYALGRDDQTFRQQPSLAKTTVTDERLRSWGFYRRDGGLKHARDADRHAITFLRRASMDEDLRMQAWPHLYGVIQADDERIVGPYHSSMHAEQSRSAAVPESTEE